MNFNYIHDNIVPLNLIKANEKFDSFDLPTRIFMNSMPPNLTQKFILSRPTLNIFVKILYTCN